MDPETISVTIDDEDNSTRVDPVTGTIETDTPDGGVVVQLDAHRPKSDDDDKEDWFDNLVDKIEAPKLTLIANDLFESITADDNSRSDYLAIRARGLTLLGTKLEEPRSTVGDSSSAVDGMSTVTNPLLLEAILKGWANAQAELLPANGPVKVKSDGDETSGEDDLAESFERDWNHWFTTTAREYYPDTSNMLLWGTYLGGSGFKKIYRCPLKRRPVSKQVSCQHLIVSNAAADFADCSRITHEIDMRPSVFRRMQFIGAYRKTGDAPPEGSAPNIVDAKIASIQGANPSANDREEDRPYKLWETQCELDLDDFIPTTSQFKGEGIPLPYLVTIDKESRDILAIRRDWDEEDAQCERKRMYVKYPYVPGPGFYGTGMLNILGNSSAAMTAAWRLALDNAMFANFPAGLIAKIGGRQNTSDFRLSPGQWQPIDTGNLPIGQVFSPNPYRDVTSGMMAMIDKITGQAQAVGGVADVPAAEGIANVPVGTMLAQIEQATKVMAAAHKGMHQAQSEEIELLADLFRAHPEDFWKSNRVCAPDYWNEQKFFDALNNCKLVPVSDPNVPSHIHRVAKALALVQLIALPAFAPLMDAPETLKRVLVALKEDPAGLVKPPMPQPSAPPVEPDKMLVAQAKMTDAQTKAQKAQSDAQTAAGDNQLKQEEIAAKERIANLDLQKEVIIHASDAEKAARGAALDERAQQHSEIVAHQDAQHQAAEHGLAAVGAVHDMAMDRAAHGLAVQEANKPEPKPAGKK